jgi:hypothetical protein
MMANFGTHLAWPTPNWVAYRVQEESTTPTPTPTPRGSKPGLLAGIMKALRRLSNAWVRANSHNAYL